MWEFWRGGFFKCGQDFKAQLHGQLLPLKGGGLSEFWSGLRNWGLSVVFGVLGGESFWLIWIYRTLKNQNQLSSRWSPFDNQVREGFKSRKKVFVETIATVAGNIVAQDFGKGLHQLLP